MTAEKRRRELANEAEAAELRFRLGSLRDERESLSAIVQQVEQGIWRRRYCAFALTILLLSGLVFTHIGLEPFGLGWSSWLWSAGVAVTCLTLGEIALELFGRARVVGVLATTGFCAGLYGIINLAAVRGLWMFLEFKLSTGGSNAEVAQFYSAAMPHLESLFVFAAVATEIAAALLLWELRRYSAVPTSNVNEARVRFAAVNEEIGRIVAQLTFLANDPAIFEAGFWRDWHLGVLQGRPQTGLRRLGKFATAAIVGAALARIAHGQPFTVIAVDLTASTALRRAGNSTEHDKNVAATASLIRLLPAGERFAVIGITDKSFSNPLVLSSGQIPTDPGPLSLLSKIDTARSELAEKFLSTAKHARPSAQQTDVIGALFVAEEMLRSSSLARRLVFFSDMRHSVPPIDIERPSAILVTPMLNAVEARRLIPNLAGVDVWILGADADGKDIGYFRSLRDFWTAYLNKSGARVRAFSPLREIPDFRRLQ